MQCRRQSRMAKHRKAWAAGTCLGIQPWPHFSFFSQSTMEVREKHRGLKEKSIRSELYLYFNSCSVREKVHIREKTIAVTGLWLST